MSLVLHREKGETWRQAAGRQARKFGMEDDVLASFDAENVDSGNDDRAAEAAFHACYEWDVLDLEPSA